MNPAARSVVEEGAQRGVTVAAAESLTAGLVCAELGGVSGASRVLLGGVVAYQNAVKSSVLGVDSDLVERNGSVDGEVAGAMSAGVRAMMGADFGVATTGVAGPLAHDGKQVGTVFIAVTGRSGTRIAEHHFAGDRQEIREQATSAALKLLLSCMTSGEQNAAANGY